MKFSGEVDNGPMNNWLNFGGDPDHHLDTGIFIDRQGLRKVVSTDCAARRCRADITIATMTSLRHRPLAEVCTVSVLLVYTVSMSAPIV